MIMGSTDAAISRGIKLELPAQRALLAGRFHDSIARIARKDLLRGCRGRLLRRGQALVILGVLFGLIPGAGLRAQSLEQAARALQTHYNRLGTLKAEFRQVYEANSVRQEESGTLWLQRPGRMRWEYRHPESKLFVADGKETYFYVSSSNQVSVRRLTNEDLHFTPFGFLIGQGDLVRDFELSEQSVRADASPGLRALQLTPRRPLENVASMALEFDASSNTIRALTIHEYSGGTSRIEFSRMEENLRLPAQLFRFKIPKGVEVVRLEEP